jgi:hypothetical protein
MKDIAIRGLAGASAPHNADLLAVLDHKINVVQYQRALTDEREKTEAYRHQRKHTVWYLKFTFLKIKLPERGQTTLALRLPKLRTSRRAAVFLWNTSRHR